MADRLGREDPVAPQAPELHLIRELVDAMSSEIGTNMLKEEQLLFPRLNGCGGIRAG